MTASPVFVCRFADGEVTRMTVFTGLNRLNLARGKILARYAYESRTGKQSPAFTEAHFERDGEVLKSYSAAELEVEVTHAEQGEHDAEIAAQSADTTR